MGFLDHPRSAAGTEFPRSSALGRLAQLTSCFIFWISSDPMDHKYVDGYYIAYS